MFIGCSGSANDEKTDDSVVTNPEYGQWQDQERIPINFELQQRFGSENIQDGIPLSNTYNLVGPVADKSGNIYLIDNRQAQLLSYDSKGNLRWRTGNEGKGPGDFLRPQGLAIKDRTLYMDNNNGSRIDEYDLEGNFLKSTPLPTDIKFTVIKDFLDNGLLVTSSSLLGEIGNRIAVFEVSDSIKFLNSFEVNLLQDIDTGGRVGAKADVSVIDSLITVGNYRDYTLAYYNIDGEEVRTVSRNFNKMVRPGIIKSEGQMQTLGSLKAPLYLNKDYFLTTLYWPTNIEDPDEFTRQAMNGNPPPVGFANSVDLFRADGILLYSVERDMLAQPKIGDIAYVDSEGYLYTKSNTPFPQIRKYKVTITPPGE